MANLFIKSLSGPSYSAGAHNMSNPLNTGVTNASIGTIYYDDLTGAWSCDISWTAPTPAVDSAVKDTLLTIQKTDVSGNGDPVSPYGTEHVLANTGGVTGPFTTHVAGLQIPDENDIYNRFVFRIWSLGYNGNQVLQVCWAGADSETIIPTHTLIPPAPTLVVALERTGSRIAGADTLERFAVQVTVTVPAVVPHEWADFSISGLDGAGPSFIQRIPLTSTPQTFSDLTNPDFLRFVPQANSTCTVSVYVGTGGASSTPGQAVASATFNVAQIGQAPVNAILDAFVGPIKADVKSGVACYGYDVTTTSASATAVPNLWTWRITVEHVDISGNLDPVYGRVPLVSFIGAGKTITAVSGIDWTYPPADSAYTGIRYKVQAESRQEPYTWVDQVDCWPGGLDYQDVFPAPPAAGQLDLGVAVTGSLGAGAVASGLELIGNVNQAPDANGQLAITKTQNAVYNVYDQKLYRWDTAIGKYRRKAESGDLELDSVTAGCIAAGAIRASDAAFETAAIQSADIKELAVSKLLAGTIAVAVSLTSPTISYSAVLGGETHSYNLDSTNGLKCAAAISGAAYSSLVDAAGFFAYYSYSGADFDAGFATNGGWCRCTAGPSINSGFFWAPNSAYLNIGGVTIFRADYNGITGGAAWNGPHTIMGTYHLWIDGSGNLRIKSGAPTGDTDGTIVGSQS
jgi:hypothetical protein